MSEEQSPASASPTSKLPLEDVLAEIHSMWFRTLDAQGNGTREAYLLIEPPQAQALKQVVDLLEILAPMKDKLAAFIKEQRLGVGAGRGTK